MIKFQNPDEYVKDYEAYKKGYNYKVILDGKSEYVKSGVLYNIAIEQYKYWHKELSVVDLKLKFKNIDI